jgi:hypothetical protein
VSAPVRNARPSLPGSATGTSTVRRPVTDRQVRARSLASATSAPAT